MSRFIAWSQFRNWTSALPAILYWSVRDCIFCHHRNRCHLVVRQLTVFQMTSLLQMGIFGDSSSPFDECIEKVTAEHLTTENWAMILDVCDKVNSDPRAPKNAILSIRKRCVLIISFDRTHFFMFMILFCKAEPPGSSCGITCSLSVGLVLEQLWTSLPERGVFSQFY